jgi:hypothetical protein
MTYTCIVAVLKDEHHERWNAVDQKRRGIGRRGQRIGFLVGPGRQDCNTTNEQSEKEKHPLQLLDILAIGMIELQRVSTMFLCNSLGKVIRVRAIVCGRDSTRFSGKNGAKQANT